MNIREAWKRLVRGRPGRRFLDFHRAECARRPDGWPKERIISLSLGTLLLVGGLAIGWLPGPGGFIAILGLALLGVEWLRIAHLLDRSEAMLRSVWRWVRRAGPREKRTAED